MESLFNLAGIDTVVVQSEEGLNIICAYTQKMKELKVLLLFEQSELWYGVDPGEEEIDVDDDNAEDDDDEEGFPENADVEEETSVQILTYDKERSYRFNLFVTNGIAWPMVMLQLVKNVIELLEKSDSKSVLKDLTLMAAGVITSDDVIRYDKKKGKSYFKSEKELFDLLILRIAENDLAKIK